MREFLRKITHTQICTMIIINEISSMYQKINWCKKPAGELGDLMRHLRKDVYGNSQWKRERKISIWHLWCIHSPERNSFYWEKNLFGTDVCPLMTFARFIFFEANFSRGNLQIYPQVERQNLCLLVAWKAASSKCCSLPLVYKIASRLQICEHIAWFFVIDFLCTCICKYIF